MRESLITLIQISLKKVSAFPRPLTTLEWKSLFVEAQRQTLVGFLFSGIENLPQEQYPPKDLLIQWYGVTASIEVQNKNQIRRIKEISDVFSKHHLQTCLLKGQGTSSLYLYPFRRQCGDVDLWVRGDRQQIIDICAKQWGIEHIDIKNIVTKDFSEVHLEVHFIPSWFYNPFINKKFYQWYSKIEDKQFVNDYQGLFCMPTISFNLVYSLVHIYKHLFDEGIGLRQLLDYYFILTHSNSEERNGAFKTLCDLRMKNFTGAVMYVLKEVCSLEERLFLTSPNPYLGEKMLLNILRDGNFGHYNDSNVHGKENRLQRGIRNIKHNTLLLLHYPSEVIWSPIWKCWHWYWRMSKGYL